MTISTFESKSPTRRLVIQKDQEFSWLERATLRRAHPVSIFCDVIAWTWTIYFLWRHQWQFALAIIVLARIGTLFMVRGLNLKSMSESALGRLALLHLHPFNLTTQILGFLTLFYGIWDRTSVTILIGFSIVLFGHIFGWSKIDPRFSLNERNN